MWVQKGPPVESGVHRLSELTQVFVVGVLVDRGAVVRVPVPLKHGPELRLDGRLRGRRRSLVDHQRRASRAHKVVTGPVRRT